MSEADPLTLQGRDQAQVGVDHGGVDPTHRSGDIQAEDHVPIAHLLVVVTHTDQSRPQQGGAEDRHDQAERLPRPCPGLAPDQHLEGG